MTTQEIYDSTDYEEGTQGKISKLQDMTDVAATDLDLIRALSLEIAQETSDPILKDLFTVSKPIRLGHQLQGG